MKNHYKAYTNKTIKLINGSYYGQGKTAKQVAKDTGRTINAVKAVLNGSGVRKNRRYSAFEIAIIKSPDTQGRVGKIIGRTAIEVNDKRYKLRKAGKL